MKKQIYISAIILFFSGMLHAQNMFYKDSIYTAPFQRLVNASNINFGADSIWDDPSFSFPLGFMFKVFNDSSSTIYNDDNGPSVGAWLSLQNLNLDRNTYVVPSSLDLVNKSISNFVSPISYATTGATPNRICKLEYRNAGLYEDSTFTDSLDMQVWFYEKSNILEYRYGNVNIKTNPADIYYASGDAGDFIGIIDSLYIDTTNFTVGTKKSYFETGNPTAPIFDSTTSLDLNNPLPGLDTSVSNNLVIRILPIKPVVVIPANIYFVDANSKIQFQFKQQAQMVSITNNSSNACVVSILNSNGALLEKQKIGIGLSNINLNNLPSSIYFIQIQNNQGFKQVYKICK